MITFGRIWFLSRYLRELENEICMLVMFLYIAEHLLDLTDDEIDRLSWAWLLFHMTNTVVMQWRGWKTILNFATITFAGMSEFLIIAREVDNQTVLIHKGKWNVQKKIL